MRPALALRSAGAARAGPAPPSAVGDGGNKGESNKPLPRLHRILRPPSSPSSASTGPPQREREQRVPRSRAANGLAEGHGGEPAQLPAAAPQQQERQSALAYAAGLFSKLPPFRGASNGEVR